MQPTSDSSFAKHAMKPERMLALGFLVLISVGGLLLTLPISASGGRSLGVLKALFTATSAVCVTGLSIIDAGMELSGFGQAVLLILLQVGGLGFMVFATLGMVALGRRISLRSRMLIRDSMNQSSLTGMVRLAIAFFLMALAIEVCGALLLMTRLVPRYGLPKGAWYSLFTSVSAFCNAGFDLFGNYRSLMDFQQEPVILLTLTVLIILGGLGFPVLMECHHAHFRLRKLSLHATLVLATTALLIVFGFVSILVLEWGNPDTLGNGMPVGDQLVNALFQSVTFRTAGFSTVDQATLTDSSKLIGIVLMFIGASSASTGGGVKTTTAAMVILMVMSVVRGHEHVIVFKREVSQGTVRRAITVVLIALAVVLLSTCCISVIERNHGFDMLDLLFETTSALSTTGLSTVNTGALTPFSHWLLLPVMYLGRVGPLTLAFALANRMEASKANRVHYPEEKIMIG